MSLCVLYRRVSTDTQDISLDAQEQRLRAYAALHNLKIAGEFCDEARSGGDLLREREGGGAMITYIEAAKSTPCPITHLVVSKLDRLARSARDLLEEVDELKLLGVTVHFADNGGDSFSTGGAMGRLFLTMLAAFAEFELASIQERTRTAMSQKRKRGEFTGGRTAPFGFNLDGSKLIRNEHEQSLIAEMRALKSQGLTFNAIARWLNDKQIPTKSGLIGRWQTGNVKGVLDRVSHEHAQSSHHASVIAPSEVPG